MASLISLRNEVYRTRSVNFHWDLKNIIEMKASNIRKSHDDSELDAAAYELSTARHSSRLSYNLDSFVAISGVTTGANAELWIGRIVDRLKHADGSIKQLRVHWYEQYGDGDVITAKYRPTFVRNQSTNKKDVPWIDKVSCASVLNCFPTLTSHRKLPILVANDLRERLPSTRR